MDLTDEERAMQAQVNHIPYLCKFIFILFVFVFFLIFIFWVLCCEIYFLYYMFSSLCSGFEILCFVEIFFSSNWKYAFWILNLGDGLAEQPEGASEAVGEEVELGEVSQRGIHFPGKIAQLKAIKKHYMVKQGKKGR